MTETEILKRVGVAITRDNFTFSSAHFAQLPDGTSERLHGHNYSVTIEVEAPTDGLGYILDFGLLKQIAISVTSELNHKVLIPTKSPRVNQSVTSATIEVIADGKRYVFPKSDVVLLPVCNTTCEELATYLLSNVEKALTMGNLRVQVMEAPNQGAFSILERRNVGSASL